MSLKSLTIGNVTYYPAKIAGIYRDSYLKLETYKERWLRINKIDVVVQENGSVLVTGPRGQFGNWAAGETEDAALRTYAYRNGLKLWEGAV